jgi:hypothetical protein
MAMSDFVPQPFFAYSPLASPNIVLAMIICAPSDERLSMPPRSAIKVLFFIL